MHSNPQSNRVSASENPYFGRVDNGPYMLGHLFRETPPYGKRLTSDDRLKAEAARSHAANGVTTLVHGIQAIGALMIRAGLSEDGDLDSVNVTAIGDLIQHLAVELRFLNEMEGTMDDVLIERVPVTKGGAR
ncbi:MAG TPA: hypothetical protein DHV59_01550 [Oxalobacteraceae bacterium]|nr:hypothetical protein [Oxalobacteraceae bacterium]